MSDASTVKSSSPGPSRPHKRTKLAGLALLFLGVLAGVFVGVRWHGTFTKLTGTPAALESKDAEPGPQAKKQLWTCGMDPQVIRDKPGICPICHMQLTPLKTDAEDPQGKSGAPQAGQRKIKYWWDPMLNPPYISDKPGKSPMGMDLVPVYEDEEKGSAARITIDPAVVQNMGLRTAVVTEGPIRRSVRLVGYLDEAQPNIRDVNLRVSGWIRRLQANTEGQHVAAGQPLFELYSPELQVAVEELIAARKARAAMQPGADDTARTASATLYDAAVQKLELLGLERTQVELLGQRDAAPATITFTSPITGDVTEKPIVAGAMVKSGDRALRIVDHTLLWLDTRVFEKDLPFVHVGQMAQATVVGRPDERLDGEVIFIHPLLDVQTRSALVRLAIPNPSLALKPGMYATVHTDAEIVERTLLVPREAVIDTGEKQVAFVALGGGKFEPRQLRMGLPGDGGVVQVSEGLKSGETVVTSGQFLLDSESRIREAIQKFLGGQASPAADGPGGTGGMPARPSPARLTEVPHSLQQKADAVFSAYLVLAESLGAEQKEARSLEVAGLAAAAQALRAELSSTQAPELANPVAEAAAAMQDQPIDRQRQSFKQLSEHVVALVEALPPSGALGEQLFLMHCPMAPGSWLQRSTAVANPFYATEMKGCGSLVKTIQTTAGAKK